MRRYITSLAVALSLSLTFAYAQTIHPEGVNSNGATLELEQRQPSTLVINLEVEKERVVVGQYARYAQELLGVRAPLVAKESARIISADVALAPSDFFVADGDMLSYGGGEIVSDVAEQLPIDITSSGVLSVEEAAEEAAEAIFTIRSLRRDILSGELGEGFYGGGLAAALERLDYEERAYCELFFGRTITSRERYMNYVTLSGVEERYIVCRFSPTEGVVASSNMKADPIVLQLIPSKQEVADAPIVDSKSRSVTFRLSNSVKCDLYNKSTIIASKSIPLHEFGYDYTHIIPITK